MSRSGYSENYDWDDNPVPAEFYERALRNALRGKKGHAFLTELGIAMDAMSDKRLIADALIADGQFCAIGVVGAKRGVAMDRLDPEDPWTVAKTFGIATALAREIVYVNDESGPVGESPEQRWVRVRDWVSKMVSARATGQEPVA